LLYVIVIINDIINKNLIQIIFLIYRKINSFEGSIKSNSSSSIISKIPKYIGNSNSSISKRSFSSKNLDINNKCM